MLDALERRSLLKCFSDLCGAADHIKWVLVVNVLVRRYLPKKIVRIHIASKLRHRNAREPWLKNLAIEHVNLHAATSDASMLLKCRLESAGAEKHARQFEIVQRFCVSIGVDIRCAD